MIRNTLWVTTWSIFANSRISFSEAFCIHALGSSLSPVTRVIGVPSRVAPRLSRVDAVGRNQDTVCGRLSRRLIDAGTPNLHRILRLLRFRVLGQALDPLKGLL